MALTTFYTLNKQLLTQFFTKLDFLNSLIFVCSVSFLVKYELCKNLGIELFFVEEADWKEDEQKVCENIRKEIAFKHWSIF